MIKKINDYRLNKLIFLSLFFYICFFTLNIQAQKKAQIFNPKANAKKDINEAVAIAKKQNKNVLLQIGGNWCPWCLKLHNFVNNDKVIDSLLNANYVFIVVNYSKENKNKEVLEELEFPQRFGFPVLVILNNDGKRIHTQNSAYLEEGKTYNRKKIIDFLNNWSVKALDPKTYL